MLTHLPTSDLKYLIEYRIYIELMRHHSENGY